MAADDHVDSLGLRIDVECRQIVHDEDSRTFDRQKQRGGQIVRPGAMIVIASNRAHGRDGTKRLEHSRRADVACVQDAIHACERAVILGQGAEYAISDFGLASAPVTLAPAPDSNAPTPVVVNAANVFPVAAAAAGGDLTLDAIERAAIAATLAQFNGNISHAAKTLGISRAALYRKLGKHGI